MKNFHLKNNGGNIWKKKLINTNNEDIKSLIYTIRGKQVMLDRDLAKLYHCKMEQNQ